MNLRNPKIDGSSTSIFQLIDGLKRDDPDTITVTGTIRVEKWEKSIMDWIGDFYWHIQSVAPVNGAGNVCNGVVTVSAKYHGYMAAFTQDGSSDPVVRSVTYARHPEWGYNHAAGVQMLGDLLPVPFENSNDSQQEGIVEFFDMTDFSNPKRLYTLVTPGSKASAVGITTYTDANAVEQALLVVYEYDHRHMYVYRCPATEVAGDSDGKPWGDPVTYTGPALHGDQFQNFALVTQTNATGDVVYLVGFREDEEVHVLSVDLSEGNQFGSLSEVGHYHGFNGSDWRAGVGLQIVDSKTIRIFGTAFDPEGERENYWFPIYIFS